MTDKLTTAWLAFERPPNWVAVAGEKVRIQGRDCIIDLRVLLFRSRTLVRPTGNMEWVVSELISGTRVASGQSRLEAIAAARKELRTQGADRTKACIMSARRLSQEVLEFA